MGFLKRLFGGKKQKPYVDKNGIYLYVKVNNVDSWVKVRADKQHDLLRTDSGYVWHKTIVDAKYFRRMQAIVHFDKNYNITSSDLDGGTFVSEEAYRLAETAVSAEEE